MLANEHPYGKWIKNVTALDNIIKGKTPEKSALSREELRTRQAAFGFTMEEIELLLHPMAEDGKEATGSMGDDTPLAVLSERYRGLHHYFRQRFSQVTNPPIDSLRERRVMSLTTRLGNLGNLLDASEEQTRRLELSSPVLSNGEFETMRAYLGDEATEIDCTFPVDGGEGALQDHLLRIRQEAEDAVRGGTTHLILTDKHIGPDRVPIPMILATGAVHTHLVQQQLRTFTSLNVQSGEDGRLAYVPIKDVILQLLTRDPGTGEGELATPCPRLTTFWAASTSCHS